MMEVLEGGIQTTIQDFPGRQGLLDQGICPAGPFDNLAFRLANVLVGNAPGDAALDRQLHLDEDRGPEQIAPLQHIGPEPREGRIRIDEGVGVDDVRCVRAAQRRPRQQ